jgi:rhodanese-related sulfurtransferase
MQIPQIHPKALQEKIQRAEPVALIDVRTREEFGCSHAPSAVNVPLSELGPEQLSGGCASAQEPVYFICRSGARARQAAEKMIAAGFDNVVLVEGGMAAWEKEGLPVEVHKKVLPVEQQVRLTIGFFVLLGSLLAYLVHPGFGLIPAFMGLGLISAGITGNCPLALAVAKMPWNRAEVPQCCMTRNS